MKRLWLEKARCEAGKTMKQVAGELGISESYYCEIENGNRQKRLDLSLATNLSLVLSIPIKTILDEEYQAAIQSA